MGSLLGECSEEDWWNQVEAQVRQAWQHPSQGKAKVEEHGLSSVISVKEEKRSAVPPQTDKWQRWQESRAPGHSENNTEERRNHFADSDPRDIEQNTWWVWWRRRAATRRESKSWWQGCQQTPEDIASQIEDVWQGHSRELLGCFPWQADYKEERSGEVSIKWWKRRLLLQRRCWKWWRLNTINCL